MTSFVSRYRSHLVHKANEAKPGLGWLVATQKQSLPWVAVLAAIVIAAASAAPFGGLPNWLIFGVCGVGLSGWLLVNVVMLAAIAGKLDRSHV